MVGVGFLRDREDKIADDCGNEKSRAIENRSRLLRTTILLFYLVVGFLVISNIIVTSGRTSRLGLNGIVGFYLLSLISQYLDYCLYAL